MYKFDVAILRKITSNDYFDNLDNIKQTNLLINFQKFLKSSFEYVQIFASGNDNFRVFDDNITKSSYGLLYMMNAITIAHASSGKNIDDLNKIYDRVINSIKTNIELFKKFNVQNKFDSNSKDKTEYNQIYNKLNDKLVELENQKLVLDKNIEIVNSDITKLSDLVSDDVKSVIDATKKLNIKRTTGLTTDNKKN